MSVTKRVIGADHRFIYGNAFRLKVSDNDIAITVSNQHAFGEDDGTGITYVDEATIMVTPRSLKVLSVVLSSAIADYENQFGAVSLPAGFEEKIAQDMTKKVRLTE